MTLGSQIALEVINAITSWRLADLRGRGRAGDLPGREVSGQHRGVLKGKRRETGRGRRRHVRQLLASLDHGVRLRAEVAARRSSGGGPSKNCSDSDQSDCRLNLDRDPESRTDRPRRQGWRHDGRLAR